MEYAIKILTDEKFFLEKALNEWESTEYTEAKKERDSMLKSINKALELIIKNK